MYSVFLVEDEIVIREGIKELVAWNEYGFHFAGEAPDGELAWPQIQKLKPDIVITDIKMPFMDGLALSRLIKREQPQTTIIILSGHDDFSYAKEAIAIGVSQYLLKPLSKDQLVEVLLETKKQKDKEQEQTQYLEKFNRELQEYLSNSRKGFFDALVSGKQLVPELLERAEKLNLNIAAESYNVVLFLLEENLLQDRYSSQLADLQNDLCARFPDGGHWFLFSISVDLMAFLIMADAEEIFEKTQACVEQIAGLCRPIEEIANWSVVVGKPVHRLSAVADCYRATRKQMFHRNSIGESHIYHVGQGGENAAPLAVDFNPDAMDAAKLDQRIIEKFLSNGLLEDVPGFVSDYFDSIDGTAVESLLFRQYIVLNIQFTVNAFLKKLECPREAVDAPVRADTALQEAAASRKGGEQYVEKLLSRALALRDKLVCSRGNNMLAKALDFLKENFTDPEINLNAAAKVANVSATHFSAVFSQQMGKTFTEYLTGLRMEKAKELLRCTDKSSGEIAFEVGYNDPHYFSFLFKKVNGCSPRDYRSGRKF